MKKETLKALGTSALLGVAAGTTASSAKMGVATFAGSGLLLLGLPKAIFSNYKYPVERATGLVGRSLFVDAKQNPSLVKFLKRWSFVYVNSKGEVIGTNKDRTELAKGRIKLGRLRLDTNKILRGEY